MKLTDKRLNKIRDVLRNGGIKETNSMVDEIESIFEGKSNFRVKRPDATVEITSIKDCCDKEFNISDFIECNLVALQYEMIGDRCDLDAFYKGEFDIYIDDQRYFIKYVINN